MELLGFGSTVAALFAFAPFMLSTGYLACRSTGIGGFHQRSGPEKLLWTIAVSTPCTVCLLVLVGYLLPPQQAGFLILALSLLALALWLPRTKLSIWRTDPALRTALGLMALLAAYLLLATVPVQSGSRIYESVAAGDWSVRVPLVDMAVHHGEPLINPFNTINGQQPRLHYYFYWTVLCGAVGATAHLPARAVQAASTVWAAYTLIATAFLLLKYVFRPTRSPLPLRQLCLLALPVGCVIGLDILPILTHLRAHPPNGPAEMEWWRASSDFSLSFHSAILYSPHHVAGLASALLCFLLLLPASALPGSAPEPPCSRLGRIVIAGICGACTVGCSTYIALMLAFICALLLAERLLSRDRTNPVTILAAGLVATLLSIPFLHEYLVTPSYGSGKSAHAHILRFALRSSGLTHHLAEQAHLRPSSPAGILFQIAFWFVYLALELGFLGIVLYIRTRADLASPSRLTFAQRAQWLLAIGFALPALFLNSDALAGSNDLGRHAGLALRLIGVLWATPLVADFLTQPATRSRTLHSWAGRFALLTVALGLSSQIYQAVSQRFYLYLSNRHLVIPSAMPFPELADSAPYYHDLYYGYQALARTGTPPGSVLYNPVSLLNSALMLYQTRPAVAPEPNCMTAFGGDIHACRAGMPALLQLFGGVDYDYIYPTVHEPYLPQSMTVEAFAAQCRQHGVAAVIASDQDPVWRNPDSFVWHTPTLHATPRIRFLSCPVTAPPQPVSR